MVMKVMWTSRLNLKTIIKDYVNLVSIIFLTSAYFLISVYNNELF